MSSTKLDYDSLNRDSKRAITKLQDVLVDLNDVVMYGILADDILAGNIDNYDDKEFLSLKKDKIDREYSVFINEIKKNYDALVEAASKALSTFDEMLLDSDLSRIGHQQAFFSKYSNQDKQLTPELRQELRDLAKKSKISDIFSRTRKIEDLLLDDLPDTAEAFIDAAREENDQFRSIKKDFEVFNKEFFVKNHGLQESYRKFKDSEKQQEATQESKRQEEEMHRQNELLKQHLTEILNCTAEELNESRRKTQEIVKDLECLVTSSDRCSFEFDAAVVRAKLGTDPQRKKAQAEIHTQILDAIAERASASIRSKNLNFELGEEVAESIAQLFCEESRNYMAYIAKNLQSDTSSVSIKQLLRKATCNYSVANDLFNTERKGYYEKKARLAIGSLSESTLDPIKNLNDSQSSAEIDTTYEAFNKHMLVFSSRFEARTQKWSHKTFNNFLKTALLKKLSNKLNEINIEPKTEEDEASKSLFDIQDKILLKLSIAQKLENMSTVELRTLVDSEKQTDDHFENIEILTPSLKSFRNRGLSDEEIRNFVVSILNTESKQNMKLTNEELYESLVSNLERTELFDIDCIKAKLNSSQSKGKTL